MTPVTMAAPKYAYDPENPSFARRKALLEGEEGNSGIAVSSFFPITRYYDAADKVLGAFEEAYTTDDLDSAFVFGKRYCTFVIEAIPKHNYYLSAIYTDLRKKHTNDAQVVLNFLEQIKDKMDVEEREKYKRRLELARIEAQRREAERKRQEQIMKQQEAAKYQELLKRAEKQKQGGVSSTTPTNGEGVQESAMSKLQMLMKQSSSASITPPPAPPANDKRPSGRYFLSDTDEDEDEVSPRSNGGKVEIGQPLPPPLPPPTDNTHLRSNGSLPPAMSPPTAEDAPPSYEFATTTTSSRRNPFLGPSNAPYAVPPPIQTWGEPRPPNYSSLPDPPSKRYPSQSKPHHPPPAPKKKKIPVRQLRDNARRQYHHLMDEGRIEIRPVDTYQGRYSQSTNGCTVISPLVVAHHLATSSGVVLPDREIKHVIDTECGPLLREIRGKLGLENHSLIIPSDVHDHLVDKNILKQDYFVGATGGNIISDEHMGEFIKLFQEKRKAGAALFFREHVVSIIKIPVGGNGRAFYDLVDSMPGTKDARGNPCASRTRCKDEEALDVLLTWYATKKFSESNCSYIDNNDWNEMMADLDPRVFQAFVWGKDE